MRKRLVRVFCSYRCDYADGNVSNGNIVRGFRTKVLNEASLVQEMEEYIKERLENKNQKAVYGVMILNYQIM